ncbi:MAG: UDP-N-acetylglucosamine 1-carboxyvinyltransferase [Myxococcota bacterium]
MHCLMVEGGRSLTGQVEISGSKNASLPLMAAALLAQGKSRLCAVPQLTDVQTLSHVLQALGAGVERRGNELHVDASCLTSTQTPAHYMRKMRASVWVLGPLLVRCGHAQTVLPGGCDLGSRPLDLHLQGFESMGVCIDESGDNITLRVPTRGLQGAKISLRVPSVGATMNLMMAACGAHGPTCIDNAASEPEVVHLAHCLRQMGATIGGEGTRSIHIEGPSVFKPFHMDMIPDRIEAATFMAAAAITKGDMRIAHCPAKHLEATTHVLQQMGCEITQDDAHQMIHVKGPQRLQPVDVCTAVYPGFATDVQPLVMACAAVAEGVSTIQETLYNNRLAPLATQLRRMGAHIEVQGDKAVVHGQAQLQGDDVKGSNLRASAALVLAGLAAQGVTCLSPLNHLDRGYNDFEKKLAALGAQVKRKVHQTDTQQPRAGLNPATTELI